MGDLMPDLIIPPELDQLIKHVSRADLDKAVFRVIADSAPPSVVKPPKYGSLSLTVVRPVPGGFQVLSSGVVAKGAEFGGRRGPKKAYVTHRKGTSYVIRRRTTMHLLPWLGTRGYAIMPAMRAGLAGVRQRILDAVAREAGL